MKQIIQKHLESLGFQKETNNSKVESLEKLYGLILKWNQKHNLISKEDEDILLERHILDSMEASHSLSLFPGEAEVLDMGSGMGFPLIPLCILFPQHNFKSIEPREKRVRILKQLKRELGLKNVELFTGKAEEFVSENTEEFFDFCTCRALGNLKEDWNRAKPYLKNGGKFITFKSASEKNTFEVDPWMSKSYSNLENQEPYYLVVREK